MYQSIQSLKTLISKSQSRSYKDPIKNYITMPFIKYWVPDFSKHISPHPHPIPAPPPSAILNNVQIKNWVTYSRESNKKIYQELKIKELNDKLNK